MAVRNRVVDLQGLTDVDLDATEVEGASTALVEDGGVWKRGTVSGGGSSDPDVPVDFLALVDQVTGDTVVATIESGAWAFASPLTTVSGDVITTVSGDPITVE